MTQIKASSSHHPLRAWTNLLQTQRHNLHNLSSETRVTHTFPQYDSKYVQIRPFRLKQEPGNTQTGTCNPWILTVWDPVLSGTIYLRAIPQGVNINSGLLVLSVVAVLLPSLLAETHTEVASHTSELSLSRFESVFLIGCYGVYLVFQLCTHRCGRTPFWKAVCGQAANCL